MADFLSYPSLYTHDMKEMAIPDLKEFIKTELSINFVKFNPMN